MNATLGALAEPNRMRIVELLRERPRPVGEIVQKLRLGQPQVSKHLKVLSDAGLVQVHPVAQKRIYGLRSEPLKELDDWLETFRRSWDDRFDRFDEALRDFKRKEKKDDR